MKQPILNQYVNGIRWYPPQILAECGDKDTFVQKWLGDAGTYPTITDEAKRVELLELAWDTAMKNIADNEAIGIIICFTETKNEKKK